MVSSQVNNYLIVISAKSKNSQLLDSSIQNPSIKNFDKYQKIQFSINTLLNSLRFVFLLIIFGTPSSCDYLMC